MRKILAVIIVSLSILLIYLGFKDNKIYYLALGDGLSLGTTPYGGIDYGYSDYVKDFLAENKMLEVFINDYSKEQYRTTDLINLIKENKTITINGKEKAIQNALIKADLISLSIGNKDLLFNLELSSDFGIVDLAKRFDSYIVDLDELFNIIRQYSKETITFTGFYDPTNNTNLKDVFNNLNNRVRELCSKYNIIYIDTYSLFENKNYITNQNNIYPSKEGYRVISGSIIDSIKPIFIKK